MHLAAILKFPLAILKMENFAMASEKIFTERFGEHNLKVSCLNPEVHDRLKKQTFPAPLQFFTRWEELVPILLGVKSMKREIVQQRFHER